MSIVCIYSVLQIISSPQVEEDWWYLLLECAGYCGSAGATELSPPFQDQDGRQGVGHGGQEPGGLSPAILIMLCYVGTYLIKHKYIYKSNLTSEIDIFPADGLWE